MSAALDAWPPALTPALRDILGFMCFQLGKMAHAYRVAGEFVDADGQPLKTRAEDEQAYMLHKFLGFWVENGDDWRTAAEEDLRRVYAVAAEKQAERPA